MKLIPLKHPQEYHDYKHRITILEDPELHKRKSTAVIAGGVVYAWARCTNEENQPTGIHPVYEIDPIEAPVGVL